MRPSIAEIPIIINLSIRAVNLQFVETIANLENKKAR